MIKPIKTHDAYFAAIDGAQKKLFGLSADKVDFIEVIDQDGDVVSINDFFTKGGQLFISVEEKEVSKIDGNDQIDMVTHYYQQKSGVITEIKELPEKPPLSRAHYDSKEFTITDYKHNKIDCTDVKNAVVESGVERFFMVDGFMHFDGAGIYFNVADGRYNDVVTVRDKGLYFWGVNNSAVEYLVGEGVLYKS